ncbi:MAG: hypothetical protein HKM24_06045 [Gammaproteobacteria bacterium]|nr:hypothetical protein [Gammaproteobacteria bacterium]
MNLAAAIIFLVGLILISLNVWDHHRGKDNQLQRRIRYRTAAIMIVISLIVTAINAQGL